MSYAVAVTVVAAAMEIFESAWQRADTPAGVLANLAAALRRGIFYFLAMHPSFWLFLYLWVRNGMGGGLLFWLVVMKGSDIALKLWMLQNDRAQSASSVLSTPMPSWMPWINLLIYPPLLLAALAD